MISTKTCPHCKGWTPTLEEEAKRVNGPVCPVCWGDGVVPRLGFWMALTCLTLATAIILLVIASQHILLLAAWSVPILCLGASTWYLGNETYRIWREYGGNHE